MHYKRLYDDKEFLYAFDLDGKEVVVEIEMVAGGVLTGEKGRSTKKPIVSFAGKTKKLALNKTNGKTIASLYGTDTDRWIGKRITLYPTTTDFGGETVECIRIRPVVPRSGKRGTPSQEPTSTVEVGEEPDLNTASPQGGDSNERR